MLEDRGGWFDENFHAKSDGKEPTVSLFKIKNGGCCIGGFTKA